MLHNNYKNYFFHEDEKYLYYDLNTIENISKLPFCIRVLLENNLRNFDGDIIKQSDISNLISWGKTNDEFSIAFYPARVLMQDFTGVPAVVDLATMRDAMNVLGKNPNKINPIIPVDLVIDHSVQVDFYGTAQSLNENLKMEYERNFERYSLLKWAQESFDNLRIVPPRTGICHQINLEYLAKVVFKEKKNSEMVAYCDTLVGTDSHTTMINSIGVLGWGVGGIEAEAVMLGQPIFLQVPKVIGLNLTGKLNEGVTATDLVLTITKLLRDEGVVEKFVEVFGDGLKTLNLADRATISNMSPEFGSTMTFFPVDDETIRYLKQTNREEQASFVETYTKINHLYYDSSSNPTYSKVLNLDLNSITPAIAGPSKPQQFIKYEDSYKNAILQSKESKSTTVLLNDDTYTLKDNDIVIAAITSCTNTSNPYVMLGAGLLAKKAVEKGLFIKPTIKTSLAPGSRVVTDYLKEAGVDEYLDKLGFNLVAYGCTTCIGNSGPLNPEIEDAITNNELSVCAVLSGNRNFEARIHPKVRQNYLTSPMLVIAYAIAGTMQIDISKNVLGLDKDGKEVYLKDIWPSNSEINELIQKCVTKQQYSKSYSNIFDGDENWKELDVTKSNIYNWIEESTYIRKAPFFDDFSISKAIQKDIINARVLAIFGDTITTDHISPAGFIPPSYPAGEYLQEKGIIPFEFNSYGSRRGNHEVMMRGTFANVRIKNFMVVPKEGGYTLQMPSKTQKYIYDVAMEYKQSNTSSVIFAGSEYGTGSSRDWAAKGTYLLGVKAVIAKSFERIHRSNLVGMGVLPLEFIDNQDVDSLNIKGDEEVCIYGIENISPKCKLKVKLKKLDNSIITFEVLCRLDSNIEVEYFKNNGILSYVLRDFLNS